MSELSDNDGALFQGYARPMPSSSFLPSGNASQWRQCPQSCRKLCLVGCLDLRLSPGKLFARGPKRLYICSNASVQPCIHSTLLKLISSLVSRQPCSIKASRDPNTRLHCIGALQVMRCDLMASGAVTDPHALGPLPAECLLSLLQSCDMEDKLLFETCRA